MTFPIDVAGILTFILCTVPRSFYASTKRKQRWSLVIILFQDLYTHTDFVKKHKTALASVLSGWSIIPWTKMVTDLIPSQSTCLGCRFHPYWAACKRQPICFSLTSMFLSLSLSFPSLRSKINKHVLGWGENKIKCKKLKSIEQSHIDLNFAVFFIWWCSLHIML